MQKIHLVAYKALVLELLPGAELTEDVRMTKQINDKYCWTISITIKHPKVGGGGTRFLFESDIEDKTLRMDQLMELGYCEFVKRFLTEGLAVQVYQPPSLRERMKMRTTLNGKAIEYTESIIVRTRIMFSFRDRLRLICGRPTEVTTETFLDGTEVLGSRSTTCVYRIIKPKKVGYGPPAEGTDIKLKENVHGHKTVTDGK